MKSSITNPDLLSLGILTLSLFYSAVELGKAPLSSSIFWFNSCYFPVSNNFFYLTIHGYDTFKDFVVV